MKLKEMSDKELIDEYEAYFQMIHSPVSCIGTKDLMWFDAIERELSNRGFKIEDKCPAVYKEDEIEID